MTRHGISETKLHLIYELHKEGKSINYITRELNLSRVTVHKYLKERGLIEVDEEAVKRGSKRLTSKEIEVIKELYNSGIKVNDIVKELEVSTATIYRHLNKRGLPKKTYTRKQLDEAVEYYNSNEATITEVSEKYGVPRSTLYWAITKRREGK